MNIKRICLIAAIMVFCFFVSSCSSIMSQGATLPPIVDANVEKVPVEGGTLRLYIPFAPGPANPLTARTKEMVSILSTVYEGLVRYDEKGNHTPCLAESWTTNVTDESVEWRFNIRKNVRWHDGTAFTAEDVVETVNLIKSDDTLRYQYNVSFIASIEAPDPHTVIIRTSTPFYGLLDAMTMPILKSGVELESPPVGTGPYMVKSYSESISGMTLVTNDSWWKRAPYISQISMLPMNNEEAALGAYSLGRLDAVATSMLSASFYKNAEDTEMLEYITQQYLYLIPNMSSKHMSDVNMRKAVASAIDKKTLLVNVFGSHAVRVEAPMFPDGMLADAGIQGPDYSESAALSYLSEMGIYMQDKQAVTRDADGSTQPVHLSLLVNESSEDQTHKDIAVIVSQMLKKIGIEVEMKLLPWEEYCAAAEAGEFDLMIAEVALSRIPELGFMLSSAGNMNYGAYASSDMDALLSQARNGRGAEAFREAMLSVTRKVTEDLPQIPLGMRTNSLVYRSSDLMLIAQLPRDLNPYAGIENWQMLADGGTATPVPSSSLAPTPTNAATMPSE